MASARCLLLGFYTPALTLPSVPFPLLFSISALPFVSQFYILGLTLFIGLCLFANNSLSCTSTKWEQNFLCFIFYIGNEESETTITEKRRPKSAKRKNRRKRGYKKREKSKNSPNELLFFLASHTRNCPPLFIMISFSKGIKKLVDKLNTFVGFKIQNASGGITWYVWGLWIS